MKNYYFKFRSLPFVYTKVRAANKPLAIKQVERYRDDGIAFEATDLAVSFENYHDNKFEFRQLATLVQKANFKITSSFTGESQIREFNKNTILEELIEYFSAPGGPPGVSKASIITIAGKSAFGIKNSDNLKVWAIGQLGALPKEMLQKQAFIPLCFFSITKEKPQEIKMLEQKIDDEEDF